jgi:hypothetical protein
VSVKWCYERLKTKTGRSKSLTHTRWSGGREYPRRGTKIRYERFDGVRGECERVSVRESGVYVFNITIKGNSGEYINRSVDLMRD